MRRRRYRAVLPLLLGCVNVLLIGWDLHNNRVIASMGMAWDTGPPLWPYEASGIAFLTLNVPAYVLATPVLRLVHLQTPEASYLVAGHEVAVVHRGNTHAPNGVAEFVGDRAAIGGMRGRFVDFAPDVAIDMILSSAAQAQATVEALRGIARRVVAASSCDVYRAMAVLHRLEPGPLEPIPLTEDSPLRTQGQTYSPEALAKARQVFEWLDAEYDKVQVERAISSDPDLPATILRLPMVYGTGDPLHRVRPGPILLAESQAQWVPCRGYVENVADAIALAAVSETAAGRIYNVGYPVPYTEAEWMAKIGPVTLVAREQPLNLAQHLFTDTSRIRAELGYAEAVSVDEALRRTVEWELTSKSEPQSR